MTSTFPELVHNVREMAARRPMNDHGNLGPLDIRFNAIIEYARTILPSLEAALHPSADLVEVLKAIPQRQVPEDLNSPPKPCLHSHTGPCYEPDYEAMAAAVQRRQGAIEEKARALAGDVLAIDHHWRDARYMIHEGWASIVAGAKALIPLALLVLTGCATAMQCPEPAVAQVRYYTFLTPIPTSSGAVLAPLAVPEWYCGDPKR